MQESIGYLKHLVKNGVMIKKKKVSQHSAYSLLCHMLRADWTGVETNRQTKNALGPMKSSSRPCVQTECDPGRVKLSVLGVIALFTDRQSFYRGSVSTSQMLECISTSSAAPRPPWPAQLLVHWHGIWRNASSLLQEKVCLGAGWRTLLSTCNPQKKRGSSTWAHSASHHPYRMSWPFWAGLSAQPCNFLRLCACSAETEAA